MRKRYRSNNKRSFNKPAKSGRKKYSKGRKSNYAKKSTYHRAHIKHDQYISKATKSGEENLYVEDVTFYDFKLHPIVQKNIRNKGYVHPTIIQNQAIPEILHGKDILGMASTGSGKTAAFLLPMITKAINNQDERCLIVVPTRELANQIRYELLTFSKGTNIMEVLIIGGASYSTQIRLLKRRPQFVIATPGRLLDLHKMKKINLYGFNNIVLDEVDRMLDMGFIRDIEYMISKLSPQKQSLFFSATINHKAESIANKFLRDPLKIQIKQQSALVNIEQNIIKYKFVGEKINKLDEFLASTDCEKVLVFSRTRRGADSLTKELQRRGHKSAVIHGEKSLGQRNRVISQFRQNDIDVLVATDVAARGIDIPDISHIINFDEPATYDDYVHRIGRTGRIGKKGVALTFVN